MSLAFELSDEQAEKLREKADEYGISPKELLEIGIEDFLNQPDEQFQQALQYTVKENSELYDRLR